MSIQKCYYFTLKPQTVNSDLHFLVISKIKLSQLAAPEVWIVSGVANSDTDKTQEEIPEKILDLKGGGELGDFSKC